MPWHKASQETCDQRTHLSEVTRILSSLDELKWSSFSLKYSSMHCSSKSCTFLSSSSVMNNSVEEKWNVRQRSKSDGAWSVGLMTFQMWTKVRRTGLGSLLNLRLNPNPIRQSVSLSPSCALESPLFFEVHLNVADLLQGLVTIIQVVRPNM